MPRCCLENKDEMAPKEVLEAAGYGFYASGIMENFSDMPYDEMIKNDIVWVGTPNDIIERIEAVQKLCAGLTEVAITVNPGGVEHWKTIKTQEMFAHHVIPHFAKQSSGGTRRAALEQIEILVLLPRGDVGFLAGLGHEAGVLGLFDMGVIVDEAAAETLAKHLVGA